MREEDKFKDGLMFRRKYVATDVQSMIEGHLVAEKELPVIVRYKDC